MAFASLLTHSLALDTASSSSSLIVDIVSLAIAVLYIVAMWVIFSKAGKPGWAAIIPIYSTIVLLQIVGRPLWWIILFLIPIVGIVFGIITLNDLSKSFGHGAGYTLGLLFLSIIFFPVLAFGGSQYAGPRGVRQAQYAHIG